MAFQVGSAFLDACVLAVLAREDTYGYVLTQKMRLVVDISESTLYPVLRRLQKNGYLSTYDSPYQGRNRRYYRITEDGIEKFEGYRDEWIWHKARVDELMFGPEPVDGAEKVILSKDELAKEKLDSEEPGVQELDNEVRGQEESIEMKADIEDENEVRGGTDHE